MQWLMWTSPENLFTQIEHKKSPCDIIFCVTGSLSWDIRGLLDCAPLDSSLAAATRKSYSWKEKRHYTFCFQVLCSKGRLASRYSLVSLPFSSTWNSRGVHGRWVKGVKGVDFKSKLWATKKPCSGHALALHWVDSSCCPGERRDCFTYHILHSLYRWHFPLSLAVDCHCNYYKIYIFFKSLPMQNCQLSKTCETLTDSMPAVSLPFCNDGARLSIPLSY